MPFVPPLPKLVIAAGKVSSALRRGPGSSAKLPSRPLGDLYACSESQQEEILQALATIKLTMTDELRRHNGEWVTLGNEIDKRTSISNLLVSCGDCWGTGAPYSSSTVNNQSLAVCGGFGDRFWLGEIIIRELIRLSGGTELDVWAVHNWLFRVNKSTYPYRYFPLDPGTAALMCHGGTKLTTVPYLAGKFTVWDNVGGQLFPLTRNSQGQLAPYGTSLIDAGAPRVLWEYPC